MTPEGVRTLVSAIRELVDFQCPAADKREMIECESSDQDMLAIHEFCSWFIAELDEGNPEGSGR